MVIAIGAVMSGELVGRIILRRGRRGRCKTLNLSDKFSKGKGLGSTTRIAIHSIGALQRRNWRGSPTWAIDISCGASITTQMVKRSSQFTPWHYKNVLSATSRRTAQFGARSKNECHERACRSRSAEMAPSRCEPMHLTHSARQERRGSRFTRTAREP